MAIYDQLKDVAKVLKEADKIEQYRQILDVQQELHDMQQKIHTLEIEKQALKDALELKEKMAYEESVYWIKKSGGQREGPYCSACFDDKNKAIRLRPHDGWPGEYQCPVCKNDFVIQSERGNSHQEFQPFDL